MKMLKGAQHEIHGWVLFCVVVAPFTVIKTRDMIMETG